MQLILEEKSTGKVEKWYTTSNQNLRMSSESNPHNVYVVEDTPED